MVAKHTWRVFVQSIQKKCSDTEKAKSIIIVKKVKIEHNFSQLSYGVRQFFLRNNENNQHDGTKKVN